MTTWYRGSLGSVKQRLARGKNGCCCNSGTSYSLRMASLNESPPLRLINVSKPLQELVTALRCLHCRLNEDCPPRAWPRCTYKVISPDLVPIRSCNADEPFNGQHCWVGDFFQQLQSKCYLRIGRHMPLNLNLVTFVELSPLTMRTPVVGLQ